MGYGLPMSLAVCIGGGGRRTILVDGDGGFQFNIQELETASRLQLPVKFFVLNNDGYASIRASQTGHFGRHNIGCDAGTGLTVPNLSRVAAAYGIPAVVIEDQRNLRQDVRRVLAMQGPVLVDVRVIADEMRAPRTQSYQKPDGSMASSPLEDMFPFLPREEFLANMIVKPLPE
jgi:acetolactate synthase-1/2/3 large subunit